MARNSIRLPQGMGFIRDLVRSLQKGDVYWEPWILKDDDVYRLFYLVGSRNLLAGSKKKALVEDVEFLKKDLYEIGFRDFEPWIRPTSPGLPNPPNWLFFTAVK